MKNRDKRAANTSSREALNVMWEHRRTLAVGLVLTLLASLSGLVLPASSRYLIDQVLVAGRHDLLPMLAGAVTLATLVRVVASFAVAQVVGVSAHRAIANLRREVQAHVTRLPVRFFDQTQSGALIARVMTDAEGIRNLVGGGMVQLVGSTATAMFALGFLLHYNWRLTAVLIAVLVVFGGGVAMAFVRLRPIFREQSRIQAAVTGRLAETLGGIRTVKAYHTEKQQDRVFTRGVHKLLRNTVKSVTGHSAANTFAMTITGGLGVVVIVLGGRAVANGTMTLGELFSYVFFVQLMITPVIQIASVGTEITQAIAGLDRIRELRNMATEMEEDEDRAPVGAIHGDVEFRDVWFEYTPGVPVLKGVSFKVPAGSTTALVGSSGSGKSTMLSMVMAFNRPTRGEVLVDGRDLDGLRLGEYRSQLGVVLQETFLFDGTVADNIRFARPDATRDEVEAAARVAHVDAFVREFPEGYETVVGERGVKLSGGQRQRIAIARAILADPSVLVLDEATSSLDSESEAMIQDGLRRLRRGRTSFVIAHRLSTIQNADQILVIEGGEIVERGTHTELMQMEGRYWKLNQRQNAWERELFVNKGEELAVTAF